MKLPTLSAENSPKLDPTSVRSVGYLDKVKARPSL